MNSIKRIVALFTLALALIAGANTVQAATSIVVVGTNTPAANVFFNGGVNGILNLATNNSFARTKPPFATRSPVTVQFSPLMGTGAAGFSVDPNNVWHLIMQDPNGNLSTFIVTDNATGAVLLQGTYRGAILHGHVGSSSLAITLMQDNVLYNAASVLLPGWAEADHGTFSIALISQQPEVLVAGFGPQAFQANGDINFGVE
jgi:hypothetical protein